MRPIHDRMPVIVAAAAYELWLDPSVTDPEVLQPLLRPSEAPALEAIAVTPRVNDPRNDDPGCIEPQPMLF
jgi:putative SOS response-associated peptidase YedK